MKTNTLLEKSFEYLIFADAGFRLVPCYRFRGPNFQIVKEALPLIRDSGWFYKGNRFVVFQIPELMATQVDYIATYETRGAAFDTAYILNSMFPELEAEEYFDVNQLKFNLKL
jgi:hypothetical protein